MHIEIISMMAATAGRERITWSGNVPFAFDGHYGSTNERIFRFFNRVDDNDVVELHRLGYDLPSLSTGDFVCWHGTTWRVDSVGFSPVSPDPRPGEVTA